MLSPRIPSLCLNKYKILALWKVKLEISSYEGFGSQDAVVLCHMFAFQEIYAMTWR